MMDIWKIIIIFYFYISIFVILFECFTFSYHGYLVLFRLQPANKPDTDSDQCSTEGGLGKRSSYLPAEWDDVVLFVEWEVCFAVFRAVRLQQAAINWKPNLCWLKILFMSYFKGGFWEQGATNIKPRLTGQSSVLAYTLTCAIIGPCTQVHRNI